MHRRYATWIVLILLFSFYSGMSDCLPQPASPPEKDPQVRLGSVTFKIREHPATASSLRVLEIQIEVMNHSRQVTAPANTIRVLVIPKEMRYAGAGPVVESLPLQEEITLSMPLSPRTGQMILAGFSLDKGDLGSATFEIQINPPDGEKKTVSANF